MDGNDFKCWIGGHIVKGRETDYVRVLIPALDMTFDLETPAPKVLVKGQPYYMPTEHIRRHFLTCGAPGPVPKGWLIQTVEV